MRISNFWSKAALQLIRTFRAKGIRKDDRGLCSLRRAMEDKLTWLALGEDQAALSRRVEQLTALLRPVKP